MEKSLNVHAFWDGEVGVWEAEGDDVPGLVAEAGMTESPVEMLKILIPELLDANGYSGGDEVPFALL